MSGEARDRGTRRLSSVSVDLAAWQIGVILVLLGSGLLFLSHVLEGAKGPDPGDTTLREGGALLLVTGALSVLWELRGRRALTDEVLAAADLSSDITKAGLRRIAMRYLEIEWDALLKEASQVDLFFVYGQTWRNTHATGLRRLVEREGTQLRVILPDRDDQALMARLADKFNYTASDLQGRIDNAEGDFANLSRQAAGRDAVELRRTTEFPVFTYYRFDRRCFGVLYSQTEGRVEVPTFECEQGGTLFEFFAGQFDALWERGSVR
ncbi:MAG TPA: hypothetical protein VK790_10135 [Solirubrobacteraceae bacterium]|jgi:hypothetical protein|nr:hypothetical protein [Solirubrobacteraceae bacterium]